MNKYDTLTKKSLENGTIDPDDIKWILESDEVELLPLLYAAYKVRHTYFENKVKIHIINNVQSGNCTEDCHYCAQSKESDGKADIYPMKSDDEIMAEAKEASENDAYRYCMVFSGRDMGKNRIKRIVNVVEQIKQKYNIEVCVSAGFLNEQDALQLKEAGVNRYNHNLNTSNNYYGSICTSHDYEKRVATINTARSVGLDICSGIIIGMGESTEDLINITNELKNVKANSVPINFFIPIEGHRIPNPQPMTPEYCLKILSIFRFTLPRAEIRAAGGREYHLRSMQALCLYPVNSIFSKGYLTTGGDSINETKKMIIDAGFVIDKIEH